MRSSAPKFARIKTGRPKTRWLRISQGDTNAKKTTDAAATPRSVLLPARQLRSHAYIPENGRNESSDGLFRAAMPQSAPNFNHGVTLSRSSSNEIATQKIVAMSRADRLVSQTHLMSQ